MYVCKQCKKSDSQEWPFCKMLPKSPSSKPVLSCKKLKTPDPRVARSPYALWDLVSTECDDFPFQDKLGDYPGINSCPEGTFMLYSDRKLVRCHNGPVHVISVYTPPPDPRPINIAPCPVCFLYGDIICNICSCFC